MRHADVQVELPLPAGTDCLALVIPGGVRGRIAEVAVHTDADLGGERGVWLVAEALLEHPTAARTRLAASGDAGLAALVDRGGLPSRHAAQLWALAVWATQAAGAPEALFDRIERVPMELRRTIGRTLLPRVASVGTQLGRRLTPQRAAGELLPLLAWLEVEPRALGLCDGPAVRSLGTLLTRESRLDPLWRSIRVAAVTGCPELAAALAGLVTHGDEQTRVAALEAFAALPLGPGSEGCGLGCAQWRRAVSDTSPVVRAAAWRALGSLIAQNAPACQLVVGKPACPNPGEALRTAVEPWPLVREAALLAAAVGPSDRRRAALGQALDDPAAEVRSRALLLLSLPGSLDQLAAPLARRILDANELLRIRKLAAEAVSVQGAATAGLRRRLAHELTQRAGPGDAAVALLLGGDGEGSGGRMGPAPPVTDLPTTP